MPNTLDQIVSEIYDECELTEDQHFVWKGNGADVRRPNEIYFDKKTYSVAKLLYAFEVSRHPSEISTLQKVCRAPNCAEPSHFIEKSQESEGPKNENGWSEVTRKKIRGSLGILDMSKDFDECVEKKSNRNDKYSDIGVERKTVKSHRASLQLKLGRPIKDNMEASHMCGNASCVNPNHLAEETAVENMQWKIHHGTGRKFTEEQHEQIREERKTQSTKQLAKKYNVSTSTIRRIVGKKVYKHKQAEVPITQFIFTDKTYEDIKLILETQCSEEVDIDGTTHLIPKTASRDSGGYAKKHFHEYYVGFHTLSLVLKLKMTRFPDSKKNEYALHNCKRKDCCLPDHVRLGTHEENMAQKKVDGTHRNHASVSDDVVRQIRNATGRYSDIARQFQTTIHVVAKIKAKIHYMDVD